MQLSMPQRADRFVSFLLAGLLALALPVHAQFPPQVPAPSSPVPVPPLSTSPQFPPPPAVSLTAPPAFQGASAAVPPAQRTLADWLQRLHNASSNRSYIGTFVVSSGGGAMASARIWHVCDGTQQLERVESLSGPPRSTFRHNDQVITFMPEQKLARSEKRDSLGVFPALLKASGATLSEHYAARYAGTDRVAGLETEVFLIEPKDRMRFGYRVWSERQTGLLMKLQTLDAAGRVIEQSAFSELQLDAPVRAERLAQMMAKTDGYRVEASDTERTTAAAEGWALKSSVGGFKPTTCVKRPSSRAGTPGESTMQWIFSDGLASVSIFVEAFDRRRHQGETQFSVGATHSITRRLTDKGGDWWVTLFGEVPIATLQVLAQGLERTR